MRSVVSSPPDGRRSYDGEEGESEHGEGDMAMPSRPGAHLVVIQPDLTLGRFKAGFDGPMVHRVPATRTRVLRGVPSGAKVR